MSRHVAYYSELYKAMLVLYLPEGQALACLVDHEMLFDRQPNLLLLQALDKQLSIRDHPHPHSSPPTLPHPIPAQIEESCFFHVSFLSCCQALQTPQDSRHYQHMMVMTGCQ